MGLLDKVKTKKNVKISICSTIDGIVSPVTETKDPVFAKKMLGDGVMIKPESNTLYAPCDATVEMIFPTKHAIGLRLLDNTSLLIHFGLDTVNLKGQGFKVFVKKAQKIKKGDIIMMVDLNFIRKNATDDCVIMVFSELETNKKIKITSTGNHKHGDEIVLLE